MSKLIKILVSIIGGLLLLVLILFIIVLIKFKFNLKEVFSMIKLITIII